MKALLTLAAATLALFLSTGINFASADTKSHESIAMQPATIQNRHNGIGVLKAVNAKAGKVQIAHEAIASLNWPAMTMWFAMRDSLPHNIKVGDTVNFELMQGENKQWNIVKIQKN